MANQGMFEIKDQFYLNGKPFQIISGGIHYFRVVPEYWKDRLIKLKALGCNTVETYIPWNLHEPQKGVMDFSKIKDIASFVTLAQELGLWVILRPSPYICAEWDFGGLPAWLLKEDGIRLRTSDPRYLTHVREYFEKLLPVLLPLQIDQGGPVLMMQVENEYGSYGNDKKYIEAVRDMMLSLGVTVPLFASDGPCDSMIKNAKVDGVYSTANFGSGTENNFQVLSKYTQGGPLMCTEFWIGWFDAWKNKIHMTGDTNVAVKEMELMLKLGNVNIYMFEGGTNFGFMNGANYSDHLTCDVTSYDYGALLTENGQVTEKYKKFQKVISEHLSVPLSEPEETIKRKAYGTLYSEGKTDLFHSLSKLSKGVKSPCPVSMERLSQNYGYILYTTYLNSDNVLTAIQMFEAADRVKVYANGTCILTAEDKELNMRHELTHIKGKGIRLDILVENMGRVNYGVKVNWQRKGIDGCVLINDQYQQHDWEIFGFPMEDLSELDFLEGYEEGMPAFHRFSFEADELCDTFLDFAGWGKGCAFINGFNLGRFWEVGPQKRLYIPAPLLKQGKNEIIIFESEGIYGDSIMLAEEPDLG